MISFLNSLGDSGSILFRNGAIHHHSKPQTHAFNTPYQLTLVPPKRRSQRAIGDTPSSADRTTLDLQHGDVLVLATDGVLDNLFHNELLQLVTTGMLATKAWEAAPTPPTTTTVAAAAALDAATLPGGLALEDFIDETAVNHIINRPSSPSPSKTTDNAATSLLAPYATCQSLLALMIASRAISASLDTRRDGPFAKETQARAHRFAHPWRGGKVDDVTTVVVVAVDEALKG